MTTQINNIQPEFKSDYLDIEQLKKRLKTETDPEILTNIKHQIFLLENVLTTYTLQHHKRND